MTSTPTPEVVAIGNAIVDVLANASLEFLAAEGLESGSMRLIDGDQAVALYERMGPAREISGGSAANSLAALAALGHGCAFIGQVADDQLGQVFTHDMRATGIAFDVPPLPGPPPTARCLILIAPDGERTMNTALAMAHRLPASAIDEDMIAGAKYLLIEGYLWDAAEPRAAIERAMAAAKRGGCKVFFALSALYLMGLYRDDFLRLIADGLIGPTEAVKAYHAVLGKLGIRPHRSLEKDLERTDTSSSYAGSKSTTSVPLSDKISKAAISVKDCGCGCGGAGTCAPEPVPAIAAASSCGCSGHVHSHNHAPSTPVITAAYPDFTKMSPVERLSYHRRRLGLG